MPNPLAKAKPLPVNDDSSFNAEDVAPEVPAAPAHSLALSAVPPPLPGWSFCTPTPPRAGDGIDPAWLVFLGIAPPTAESAVQDDAWQELLRR